MNTQSIANHLAEYVRSEIEAKTAALKWIDAQEVAIATNDPAALEMAVKELNTLLAGEQRRVLRRGELIARLADKWNVPAQTLSLGGVVHRLGDGGAHLDALRQELRSIVATVMKRNRRLAALIGLQRRITTDVMQLVLGSDEEGALGHGGSLVNAEA